MTRDWQDSVYVGTSSIDGLGVFSRRVFDTGEVIFPWEQRILTGEEPLAEGEEERHCMRLSQGRVAYKGFPARFVNHSCDANCFLRYRGEGREVVALKPVRPGDEISIHYGVDRAEEAPMTCSCGTERCLGTLPGSFFELPLEVQLELSPLLSEWFVAEHHEAYRRFLDEAGLDEIQL